MRTLDNIFCKDYREGNDLGHIGRVDIQQLLFIATDRDAECLDFVIGREHNNVVQEHEPPTDRLVTLVIIKRDPTQTVVH